ncbi:hypothetical protein PBRA_003409 [Plasmodiophora brassicae]|uniref:DNA repair protein REV1 n=1 Tax=Plasmodiophora brassicae TaxID=37360 RepID=A0A0G4J8G2_PLABS|nr:hypothetical protein PBRA_003409 [Plasmodiophora brassicae]
MDPSRAPFESMGDYMSNKRAKIDRQFAVIRPVSDLFKGVCVYVNGSTNPTCRELWKMVRMHGGEFQHTMHPSVTHVIANSLAATKATLLKKSARLSVVTPEWLLRSITENRLLPCSQFRPGDMIDRSQSSLNPFMSPMKPAVSAPRHNHVEADDTASDASQDDNLDVVDSAPRASAGHTEETIMKVLGDRRFHLPVKHDSLPSFTLTDPDFVKSYFSQSRLHFIGSWKEKFECTLLPSLLAEKPKFSMRPGQRGHVLHVDMDCFFASVSIRDRPELADKAVVVSHSSKTGNGEISTCNYVARSFGIRSGMWMKAAIQLCPALHVVGFEFEKYAVASEAVYRTCFRYTHAVQVVSCDEALLEIPAEEDPEAIGQCIREDIKRETGCPASIGIASSILFARLANRSAKPDGLHWIKEIDQAEVLSNLKARDLPGVGPETARRLKEALNVDTVAELQRVPLESLQDTLGRSVGQMLHDFARGVDKRTLKTNHKPRTSLGAELGWGVRFFTEEQVNFFLKALCEEVSKKLSIANRFGQALTLKIKVRSADAPVYPHKFLGQGMCDVVTRHESVPGATRDPDALFDICRNLMRDMKIPPDQIRAVGLQVSKLESSARSVNTINKYLGNSAPGGKREAAASPPGRAEPNREVPPSRPQIQRNEQTGLEHLDPSTREFLLQIPEELRAEQLMQLARLRPPKNQVPVQPERRPPPAASSVKKEQPQRNSPSGVAYLGEKLVVAELRHIPASIRTELLAEYGRSLRVKKQKSKIPTFFRRKDPDPSPTDSKFQVAIQAESGNQASERSCLISFATANDTQGLRKAFLDMAEKSAADRVVSALLELIDDARFLEVELALKAWRRQCTDALAFNRVLEIVQQSAQATLGGRFKIEPIDSASSSNARG